MPSQIVHQLTTSHCHHTCTLVGGCSRLQTILPPFDHPTFQQAAWTLLTAGRSLDFLVLPLCFQFIKPVVNKVCSLFKPTSFPSPPLPSSPLSPQCGHMRLLLIMAVFIREILYIFLRDPQIF